MKRARTALSLAWSAYPLAVLATLASTLFLGIAPVASAWLAKVTIDLMAAGQPTDLWVFLALTGGLGLALLFGQVTQNWVAYLQSQLARRIEFLVQGRLFENLNELPGLRAFERPRFHDRIQLAQQAGLTAPRQLVDAGSGIIQGTVSLVGFLAALLAISPRVAALACAAAVPQLIAELRLAGQRVQLEFSLSPTERRRHFYSRLQSDPQAAKELRLFGLGAFFRSRMLAELRTIHRSEQRLDRKVLRVQTALDAGSAVVIMAALGIMAWQAARGSISPGDVAVFVLGLPAVVAAASALVSQIGQGAGALLLIGHYQAFMDATPVPVRTVPQQSVPHLRQAVVLSDVWFRYAEDLPWVLRGVTMEIPYGRSVALVGLNGAGKSTLVKLITRLYEPTKGRVTWDGIDLRRLDHEALRRRMGAVFQDYMAYDMTAAENIGIGDLNRLADHDAIVCSAERAGLDATIRHLPRGYQTMLSVLHFGDDDEQSGVQLSGGQWQRLALARMLLRADRDLLVLDEPSAGLDAQAEQQVHELIHDLTGGTTRLLISHRLNAVRMADNIVVLDDGRIVEEGDHEQLMKADGRYAALFRAQAEGYRDVAPRPGEWGGQGG